jgi:hypothetical protein
MAERLLCVKLSHHLLKSRNEMITLTRNEQLCHTWVENMVLYQLKLESSEDIMPRKLGLFC